MRTVRETGLRSSMSLESVTFLQARVSRRSQSVDEELLDAVSHLHDEVVVP